MPYFACIVGGWVQKKGKFCLRNKSMAPSGIVVSIKIHRLVSSILFWNIHKYDFAVTLSVSNFQAPPRPPAALDPDLVDLGDGVAGSFCCHPQRFGHRITALVLMCLLGFGSYFCFDNPGALQVR